MFFNNLAAFSANTLRRSACVLAVATALTAGAPLAAIAQEAAAPAAEGATVAFPAAQVRRGTPLYAENCSSCHGDRLDGALDAPTLTGADFQANWFGQPLSALYEYTSVNMPQDRPGGLEPQAYADILAFILSKNDIKATDGAAELPGDAAALAAVMLPPAP